MNGKGLKGTRVQGLQSALTIAPKLGLEKTVRTMDE